MNALAKANEIRSARAKYKKDLADRIIGPQQLLFETPDYVLDVAVFEAVQWIPGIGFERAKRILLAAGISRTLPMGAIRGGHRDRIWEGVRHRQPDRFQVAA